jgi:outer membrane protein OmpA-like peptidoglycan-associated protein
MRSSLAVLALSLAASGLMAADKQEDFRWIQFQGGVTDHRTSNYDHQQPAIGFGVGTWVNDHCGLEASGLGTFVDYGHGKSKETHATFSALYNPFQASEIFRPFLRLGLGSVTVGSPLSHKPTYTTRLDRIAGLGVQVQLPKQMLFSLEGRLSEMATVPGRKESQLLAGFGIRWGNRPATATVNEAVNAAVAKALPAAVAAALPAAVAAAVQPAVAKAVPEAVAAAAPAQVAAIAAQTSAAPAPKTVVEEALLHFANNKATLTQESRQLIEKLAAQLKAAKLPYKIVLSGHASKTGNAARNLRLSQARAAAVVKALEAAGIPEEAIYSAGMGSHHPRVKEATKADQAKNRRAEVRIEIQSGNVEIHSSQTPTVE